jgi:hypothetical protein
MPVGVGVGERADEVVGAGGQRLLRRAGLAALDVLDAAPDVGLQVRGDHAALLAGGRLEVLQELGLRLLGVDPDEAGLVHQLAVVLQLDLDEPALDRGRHVDELAVLGRDRDLAAVSAAAGLGFGRLAGVSAGFYRRVLIIAAGTAQEQGQGGQQRKELPIQFPAS